MSQSWQAHRFTYMYLAASIPLLVTSAAATALLACPHALAANNDDDAPPVKPQATPIAPRAAIQGFSRAASAYMNNFGQDASASVPTFTGAPATAGGAQAGAPGLSPKPGAPAPNSAAPATAAKKPPVVQLKSGTSTVQGKVVDADNGTPIGDAAVLLQRAGKDGARLEQEVQDDGSFSFPNIEEGEWDLTISAEGMFSQTKRVVIKKGETQNFPIAMEELESTDVLRITGKRTLTHPERIGSTTDLDRRFLDQYKSGNDLKQVIQSTPGVMADSFGNIITRGEHNAVNYEVDGVVLPEAPNSINQGQFASPRALQSVSVDIGGYEARDGGGPLGAVARLKTLPIQTKPSLEYGGQIGGPIAGTIYYRATGAASQDPSSIWNRVRFESVGQATGNSYGIQAPAKFYRNNGRANLNFMNKLEFAPNEYNTFKIIAALNSSFAQQPTNIMSANAGVRQKLTERDHYLIMSWNRRGRKYFDEANLHFVNAFYQQLGQSNLAFDPFPNLVGEEPLLASTAFTGRRFNYAFSAQGDIKKRIFNTHNLYAGFLSEIRPVTTSFSGIYFNTDRNLMPIGGLISPFTRTFDGPQFTGGIGKYKGFRYLQSAYFQDTWKPETGFLKRLTLNAGARFDLYHGIFGNTLGVANAMQNIPGIQPFDVSRFQKQSVTDAQVSGRFGGTFALTKSTVLRGSYSQIFQPPPVDVFVTPPNVSEDPIFGIYPGTVRPLRATRGSLVDASIEQQIGPRFVLRNNLYYKRLKNFGDSGVVQNTPLYNRLTLSNQEAYGCETRMELRPARDGTGLNGFISSTVAVAYLRGSKATTGGIWEPDMAPVLAKYPDHDRRYTLQSGLGYRWKSGLWCLGECGVLTGLQNQLDPALFGPHRARTPVVTIIGLNAGYEMPKKYHDKSRLLPTSFDVRIDNLTNQRTPLNLGSPFQGNRFMLPIRILAGMYWKV